MNLLHKNKKFLLIIAGVLCALILVGGIFIKTTGFEFNFIKKEEATKSKSDTTPPVVSCDIKTKTITTEDVISVNKLGLHITDDSKIESIGFCKISSTNFYTGLPDEEIADMVSIYKEGIDMWAEEFQFSYGGFYTMTIKVTDIHGNSSEISIDIIVETAPVINAPSDIYVATDSTIDYSQFIAAWDFVDGDLDFNTIEIDSSQLNTGTIGTYPVYFTARDSYGLTSTACTLVNVCDASSLQDLINTHEINISDHVIMGAINPYDMGYYESASADDVLGGLSLASVQLTNQSNSTVGYGFIIHIDDEFVTIATTDTIVSNTLEVEVCFADGTTRLGSVVALNEQEHIAFVRLLVSDSGSTSSVLPEYLKNLRTVHIDSAYSDVSTGTLSIGGAGSAYLDSWGRLVGLYRGYGNSTVSVVDILDYYELVFKTRVEYQ